MDGEYNMNKGKIFVALDVDSKKEAFKIVEDLKGLGAGFKIGKQLFTAEGPTLVKKIVESYNGEIWVEDKIKGDFTKGSNFVLMIPKAL